MALVANGARALLTLPLLGAGQVVFCPPAVSFDGGKFAMRAADRLQPLTSMLKPLWSRRTS